MKKWSGERKKGFLQGLIVPVLVIALVTGVLAAGSLQQIDAVVGGINIYVDGLKLEPKDANNQPVQPIAWNGTTYLPIRALTKALTDKPVTWDQETMSVYIGKVPGKPKISLDKLPMYNSIRVGMSTGSSAAFWKLDKTVEPMLNRLAFQGDTGYAIYSLDSQYKTLTAKLDIPYTELGVKWQSGVAFYSLDQYGERTLIDTFFTCAGDEPVEITIPLTGVRFLEICNLCGSTDQGGWKTAPYYSEDWPDYGSDYSTTYSLIYDAVLTPVD